MINIPELHLVTKTPTMPGIEHGTSSLLCLMASMAPPFTQCTHLALILKKSCFQCHLFSSLPTHLGVRYIPPLVLCIKFETIVWSTDQSQQCYPQADTQMATQIEYFCNLLSFRPCNDMCHLFCH